MAGDLRTKAATTVEKKSTTEILTEVYERSHILDWVFLFSIPGILVSVFVLPESVRLDYVFAYQQPTVTTMYTSHFVHLRFGHLKSNIVVYSSIVPVVYLYSLLANRRSHFYIASITFLSVFPFVFSSIDLIFTRPRIGYGFSGILTSFLGFLPLTLLWFLESHGKGRFYADHAPLLFFLATGVISIRSVPPAPERLIGITISVGASLLYLWSLVTDLSSTKSLIVIDPDVSFIIAGIGLSLFIFFVFAAFPPAIRGDETIVGLLSHLLGFCFGFIVPYATFQLTALD